MPEVRCKATVYYCNNPTSRSDLPKRLLGARKGEMFTGVGAYQCPTILCGPRHFTVPFYRKAISGRDTDTYHDVQLPCVEN